MFLVFTFIIQLSINIWASTKLCNQDAKKPDVNIGKAFGYTLIPWALILVLISFILYIMPGWVRIFSNTIGLAVVRSVYADLFEQKKPVTVNAEPSNGTNSTTNPVNSLSDDLLSKIYHDPSKLINEVEYMPDFKTWKETIFDGYLKNLPYFKEPYFEVNDTIESKRLFIPPTDSDTAQTYNKNHPIYQLYKCVATKEKIGYFTWLFVSGAIFVLVSLSQMYQADC